MDNYDFSDNVVYFEFMIYITGDTYSDFFEIYIKMFPIQSKMTKVDYIIICGDFGGVCGAIFKKAGFELDKECNEIGHCNRLCF